MCRRNLTVESDLWKGQCEWKDKKGYLVCDGKHGWSLLRLHDQTIVEKAKQKKKSG